MLPMNKQVCFAMPTSFAQRRLWFISQLVPDSAIYNIAFAIRIEGNLQLKALRLALEEVIRRHEILRTVFLCRSGDAVQLIAPASPVNLLLIDVRELPDRGRDAAVDAILTDESQRAFDLARGPLLRLSLLRRQDRDHILLFTVHHIIYDAWSHSVLLREVNALYEAFRENKPSPLDPLELQYADYAVWQRDRRRGE